MLEKSLPVLPNYKQEKNKKQHIFHTVIVAKEMLFNKNDYNVQSKTSLVLTVALQQNTLAVVFQTAVAEITEKLHAKCLRCINSPMTSMWEIDINN